VGHHLAIHFTTVLIGLAALTGLGFTIYTNVLFYSMLNEVNDHLSEADQIPLIGLKGRESNVLRRHRNLFPVSKRRRLYTVARIVAAVFFIGAWFGLLVTSPSACQVTPRRLKSAQDSNLAPSSPR
jgi:hypothetical protein